MEKLSIIIPAYNEQDTIEEVLRHVKAAKVSGVKKEIIIVDDASTDSTPSILRSLKGKDFKVITHRKNAGKGAAVRTGFKSSTGDIFLIQDADLEYSPSDYPALIAPILEGKTQVVFGSRIESIKRNLRDMYLLHYLGNRLLSLATSVLYGSWVSDMETCYKVFRREVVEGMPLHSRRFDIEPELTAKILKRGYRIFEVPINFKGRTFMEGKKITWRDGIVALMTLLRYRFRD